MRQLGRRGSVIRLSQTPFHRLDVLLRNAAQYLTAWGQKKVGNVKLQIAIANWVILQVCS